MTNSVRYALFSALVLIAAAATATGLYLLHDRRLSDAVAADHLAAIRSAQTLVERAQTDAGVLWRVRAGPPIWRAKAGGAGAGLGRGKRPAIGQRGSAFSSTRTGIP